MGVRYERNCVDCGFSCIQESCPYYRQKVLYCDKCGSEEEELYIVDGKELCRECALEALERITEYDVED